MSMSNTEKTVKEIRRNTRRKFSTEEKMRIVLDGLQGESSVAELCRQEGINPNLYISNDATEKTMAWTTAGSRSGMGGYELLDQLSEPFFRPAGGYVANFSRSVSSNSEEIYSRQALYSSYTF